MPVPPAEEPVIGALLRAGELDAAIAALARGQHGVVARRQLLALGLGRRAIGHRIERGRLHAVHWGVYAVGYPAISLRGAWMAAVLAVGPEAVLSHRSAAALWGIRPTTRTRSDVSSPRELRPRRGIQPHSATLPRDEVTVHRGIPVTTPPRTLLDLAAILPPHHLERAMSEAERQRLADPLSLDVLLRRHGGRDGTSALRRELARIRPGGITLTRSELEDRFLAFLDLHDLERPATNVPLTLANGQRLEADCVWRQHRLIVELDGYATHASRTAFERDRTRDRRLQAAGWRIVRITWRQLHDEPRDVAAELRALLTAQAARGAARLAPSG